MRIVLPGGTGQIGTLLARHFAARGGEVTVLSRSGPAEPTRERPWRTIGWDARTEGPWSDALEGAAAVINLAGRTVNCRYTRANLRQIMDSRVDSTRVIGRAIARLTRDGRSPPPVWLQSSTATIYAHRFDAPNDERSGLIGGAEPGAPAYWSFSIDVARAWERACTEADCPDTRRVLLRSAIVMTPDRGGVFDALLGLVRRGLGGRAGDGRQYVSWIHGADFLGAIDLLLARPDLEGPINICSPNPLPNQEFMRDLRRAAGARIGLPASRWMHEIGAVFMRTDTELILKSRRVAPTRLLEAGYHFRFPDWPAAAADLCRRRRENSPP